MKSRLACLIFFALSVLPTTSHAQSFFRTFVSGLGNDGNPCTRTQPCLTFTRALAQTFAGGEIDVLDPGGYGPFTINKPISIIADGIGPVGIKPAAGASAITINAGASDTVNLRGLVVEGAGSGVSGIVFNSGARLTIVNTVVRNFSSHGIAVTPNNLASVSISNSSITNNGGDGVHVEPTGTNVIDLLEFDGVEAKQNGGSGFNIVGTSTSGTSLINATASHCVSSQNVVHGFAASGADVNFDIVHSVASSNGNTGITSSLSQTTVGDTLIGRNTGATWTGSVVSYGDNYAGANNAPGGLQSKR